MDCNPGPIGVFDSGYGGLTVFREIAAALPQYDYIYLGDNARAPYGIRSFEVIYRYTLECVERLFAMGCPLVILACNTASAKALRTIQQRDLVARYAPQHRVLGVIRPTAEVIGAYSKTRSVGILATSGTVSSNSYALEIEHFFPDIKVYQQACPLWVPLIENGEYDGEGADFFVKKYIDALLAQSSEIDGIVLGCTHYPLMLPKIRQYTPPHIQLVAQGTIVAHSLADYLQRHAWMDALCTKGGTRRFFTSENDATAADKVGLFYGQSVEVQHIDL
jgi:glutamate racemase